jgi:hypothetical protein
MEQENKVLAKVIVEVVGTPKDHVENSVKLVLDNIKKEKGIKPIKMKIFKPKAVDNYFSSFAELELEFSNPAALLGMCFDYMPSSVEIVRPEKLNMDSNGLASLLNDLLLKLHNISMNVRKLNIENNNLRLNSEALLKNITMLSIGKSEKTIEEISKEVGVKPASLRPFVDKYVKDGKISLKDGRYRLKESLYKEKKGNK